MKNCVSHKFIFNDKVLPCAEFDKRFPTGSISIYEVVRIYNGIPLFHEDHCARLQKSADLTKLTLLICQSEIREKISTLIKVNNQNIGNVRIVVNQQTIKGKSENNLIISFIKHHYPTKHEILSGVIAQTVIAERKNPNAKTINTKLRSLLDSIINSTKIYETIMVNKKGYLTEGSRSNVFFVKSDKLFTTPLSKVLPGITRQKIIDICNMESIELVEDCIPLTELSSFEAIFISGTSPGILPLKQINKHRLQIGHSIVSNIADQYNKIVDNYIDCR